MVLNMFRHISAPVLIDNRKLRVQVSSLMQTALDVFFLKAGLFKNLRVWQKVNPRPSLPGLANDRKKPFFQRNHRVTAFIPIMMDLAIQIYFQIQVDGEGVHHRRTHAVKASAGLISLIVKFPSCMERGKYQACRRQSFLMHPHRNAASIVFHRAGAVLLQSHLYNVTISCQMLIHRIIHNLINQMIQTFAGHATDVHARPFPYGFQTFQHCNIPGAVFLFLCHVLSPFPSFAMSRSYTIPLRPASGSGLG